MKALICKKYGSPDVLQIKEVEKPVPQNHEVLVKVFATTVNRTDCATVRAKPFSARFYSGLLKPKKSILGTDFAGTVESVGKDVKAFKKGDNVFGLNDQGLCSHAQYLCISENDAILTIPKNITFVEAAASLEGAHYAINFINKVPLNSEHKVLVNGATGAIGSAAVQIVKYYGANVTAVCATPNITLVKELGADRVIDYLKTDFTKENIQYDFVFDAVGKNSFGKCKSILKPGGFYISSDLGEMAQNLFFALIKPIIGSKKVIFPVPIDTKASLTLIKKMLAENKFKPMMDKTYRFNEIIEAYWYVESGRKTGNVIIDYTHEV